MQLINRFSRYVVLCFTASFLLYGCGESKISQCNKIVSVANKAKELAVPKEMAGLVTSAEEIEKIRVEVQAIAVQDPKLKELQADMIGMYGDVSVAMQAQVKATEAKDANAQKKAKEDLDAAVSRESSVVDTVNALCSK
ncbi:hypothetical protein [Pseudanabaena mucicola]|uniref:Lipoprotein n=1 Tax=Pseudanabaena mucicola FACHB-723 TaxID=2692860 RepID=A0ABR7ZU60_9CYAN|nr:hypothetical protein [Pseudanabaena mucicola]MBD2186928.1 hypothetical protein [Pseudanabaena mucicola FACHB-723]